MTPLHALFIRRVQEEMDDRCLNPNRLNSLGAVQRTLADAIKKNTDIRLSTVFKTATAMGITDPSVLLREKPTKKASNRQNVADFPPPPPMFPPEHGRAPRKTRDRKKSRG